MKVQYIASLFDENLSNASIFSVHSIQDVDVNRFQQAQKILEARFGSDALLLLLPMSPAGKTDIELIEAYQDIYLLPNASWTEIVLETFMINQAFMMELTIDSDDESRFLTQHLPQLMDEKLIDALYEEKGLIVAAFF